VTELGGLLWLVGGLGCLLVASSLVACRLRIRSPIEFLLATYVIAWSWLVAVVLLLSPVRLVTRSWIVGVLVVGLVVALTAWRAFGMRRPPPIDPVLDGLREGLRHPAVAVLAVGVSLGVAYSLALAFFTPGNEGDVLTYHLARAAFWYQENGLGYVQGSVDPRLDGNPPNAEIGQLLTIVLSGSDRYVALPQLGAYASLVLCVAALARRIGLDVREALFAALAFATLPVLVLQASSALNDLVVASFLSCAAVFALQSRRSQLVLFALALGLTLGTKFTAILLLPTLVVVVMAGRPARAWPRLAVAGLAGCVLGSTWYVVNLVETGDPDGGASLYVGDQAAQRADLSPPSMATTVLRLVLDAVDMSGASLRHSMLFLAGAAVIALLSLARPFAPHRRALLAGAVLTASVLLLFPLGALGERAVHGAWTLMGTPSTPSFDDAGPMPNVDADTLWSWYGPLGVLLLAFGPVVVLRSRRSVPLSALALSLAPWVTLVTLALTIVWDPYRGRFLAFGVALAASTWGLWLRRVSLAAAVTAIGVIALFLSLANYLGKPSGFGELWARGGSVSWSAASIWSDGRPEAQIRLRPGGGELTVLEYFEAHVPADADVAIAPRENDFLSPYFGARLSRRVSLLQPGDLVPSSSEWLVLSPGTTLDECGGVWEGVLPDDSGWRVEHRVGPGTCKVASNA
jgi:hypothetical protein